MFYRGATIRKAVNVTKENETKLATDWGHKNAPVLREARATTCQNFIDNAAATNAVAWLDHLRRELASHERTDGE
jgi:hypothetical protein